MTAPNLPKLLSANRSAGLLLHPSSLPGPYGIGDLGPEAYRWVETLARANQKWWQILPLGPTGYGDSPYQSLSAFAGNTNLLSPDLLLQDGLLEPNDVAGLHFTSDQVEYEHVIPFKKHLLSTAWDRYKGGRNPDLRGSFANFCQKHQAAWLDDFALFRAFKEANGHRGWQDWPNEMMRREPKAMQAARQQLADEIEKHRFGQFLFARQWQDLKLFANSKGIRLIGDVPIFVASDSADVWANSQLFTLDARRRPTVVAGVPPDYFSATGQLWGNPLYRWDVSAQSGHQWWISRMRATLDLVDFVRIDHFRGFEAYWEIPATAPTAQTGKWVKGPGFELFKVLKSSLGELPLIAEDLGVITPEVEALRDQLGFPGMRVLQFAFGDTAKNLYLPHNYVRNTVVYTGTHDNDTTEGWYASQPENERSMLHRYLTIDSTGAARSLMRLAWSSVADYAIAPLQDLLSLGAEARMNTPGKPAGNWRWRMKPEAIGQNLIDWLAEITWIYGR